LVAKQQLYHANVMLISVTYSCRARSGLHSCLAQCWELKFTPYKMQQTTPPGLETTRQVPILRALGDKARYCSESVSRLS